MAILPNAGYSTSKIPTESIGDTVYQMMNMVKGRRVNFERKWYDNNFFDDGYHYRFYSRAANKIVDVSDRATMFAPMRAIPKASRQIRGVANLLVSPDYIPIIYPEKIDDAKTPQYIPQPDPQSGQMTQVPNPAYEQEKKKNEDNAHKVSRWMMKEWETQEMIEKLGFMAILAAKHGVSWIQVWPDAIKETIKTQVYDAFDIYVPGELTDPEDAPFMIKAIPMLISEIKANENFDEDQLKKISPDNKFASSDIKEAYMGTRFNKMGTTDSAATLILKEAYIKEYLNDDNRANIKLQDDADEILKDKENGDMVMRQVFVAGNVWLRDRYVNLPSYPFIDFRFEPGPIYQVPLIERFIPQNKSLDALISRAERYSHTMVTGSWSQKTGEQYEITNDAGGQVLKYMSTPPIQNQIAPIPSFFFELIGLLGNLMEEQGVSTSLGHIPSGVKAHAAIESLKETEYANLVIATRRFKGTINRIAERMMDLADIHYITPKTVYDMENGKASYFDVIGASAMKGRSKLKIENPDGVVAINKDYKCEIEVQSGMGYTQEGKKAAAKELGDFFLQMAQMQLLSPEVVKAFVKQLLDIYKFGPTEDIMEALNNPDFGSQMSEQQLMMIKTAVLEALKDAGEVGQEASDKRLMENKVGALEALKDVGLADGVPQNPKIQVEIQALQQKMKQDEETHQLEMAKMRQEMALSEESTSADIQTEKIEAAHSMSMKEEQSQHQMAQTEQLTKAKAKQLEKMPVMAKGGSSATKSKK